MQILAGLYHRLVVHCNVFSVNSVYSLIHLICLVKKKRFTIIEKITDANFSVSVIVKCLWPADCSDQAVYDLVAVISHQGTARDSTSSFLAHTEHAVGVGEPVRPLYYLSCCLSAFERNIDFMVRHFSQDHSTVSGTDNLLLTIPMLQLSSKKPFPCASASVASSWLSGHTI